MDRHELQSLKLIIGGDKSNIFEMKEGEDLTIGRDPGCTIQITHSSISPIHCRLTFKSGVLFVSDLDSVQGISFNKTKRKHFEFKGDAVFEVGPVEIAAVRGDFWKIPISTHSVDLIKRKVRFGTAAEITPKSSLYVYRRKRVAASSSVERRFRRHLPFLATSFGFHMVILLIVADIPFLTKQMQAARQVISEFLAYSEKIEFEAEKTRDEKEFEAPDLPIDDYIRPDAEKLVDEEIFEIIDELPGEIGITMPDGREKGSGLSSEGVARFGSDDFSEGFADYINELRTKGLDVAFVIDSTSSMEPFIGEAKRVVNQLISKLAAVVPNLRFALVSYRDKGDEYVTRCLDLTGDRYEILNFLEDCQAVGGGDFPEAVYDALLRATQSLIWRPNARKVIILVGDAPFHPQDEAKVDRLLREFCCRENTAVVNTVYVGPVSDSPDEDHKNAIYSMKHIAQISGGDYSRIADNDRIIMQLVNIAFGSRWDSDITRLLESTQKDKLTRIVDRKAKDGQVQWLREGILRLPVRAGIVDA
ncbi:MAG: FHA domain-containing protein, partial [bacterium]